MALNRNKKRRNLADLSIHPSGEEGYPNPDESIPCKRIKIDFAELGLAINGRVWETPDDLVYQFALMLNATPEHPSYLLCKSLRGGCSNFSQIRRIDTWHSSIHSHQYYIDAESEEREVLVKLFGGNRYVESQKVVNGEYQKHYNEITFMPFEYVELWEKGKSDGA